MAGYQVIVDPARVDIFDMNVPHPLKEFLERCRRIFSGTKKMADVKIQPYGRGLDVSDKRFELCRVFHQQVRLRFHQNVHAQLFCQWNYLFQAMVEQGHGIISRQIA